MFLLKQNIHQSNTYFYFFNPAQNELYFLIAINHSFFVTI